MWIRKSGLALWIFLACAITLLPIACGDDDDTSNQVQDAASEKAPLPMTGS